MSLPDALQAMLEVARKLEDLGVPYLVGGSLASSLYGIPRSTQDADLVADLRPEHVQPLVAALSPSFYADSERAADAVRRRASFNVIHLATMTKVDIFVMTDEPLDLEEMARRQILPVGEAGTPVPVASAEDTVLQKLVWFRKGGGVSERQWNDVLGVLKVRRGRIDLDYLRLWASRLDLDDLLDRALEDAGTDT
ncbi:MAG: hypothetical protein ABUT39_15495 [Acidobacteriota bacterium]